MPARFPAPAVPEAYPLTPLQHGMLFQALLAPGSGVNVEQLVCTLREPVDAGRMAEAWARLARRHDILRTRFRWEDVPEAVQEVADEVHIPIDHHDHTGLAPDEREARLRRWLDEDRARGFDLGRAPAMRVALFAHADDEHVLVWSFHHVLLDGRSVTHLLHELFTLYDTARDGAPAVLPPRRPFREHVAWLGARDGAADEAYWSGVLRGFAGPVPLPAGRRAPRDPAAEPAYGEREIRLSVEDTAALRAFESQQGVWLSTLVQGAWALLLGRCTDAGEAVFGVVRAGRGSGVEGVDDMVGLIANTVPVRVPLPAATPVLDWLDALGERLAALPAHEHAALPDIARWGGLPQGAALFDTLLDYQPWPFDAPFRALGGRWEDRGFHILRNPGAALALAVTGETPLRIRMGYDADRYDAAAVDRLLGHFGHLLRELAADPDRPLGALDPLDAAERRRVAAAWNGTAAPYPLDRCVHELFQARAAATPDAPALRLDDGIVSYRELDAAAERIERRLRRLGVGPEKRVGLCLHPGVEMVAAVLGVMKAGGAFVPLDPATPANRVQALLRDFDAAALVTQQSILPTLPEHDVALLVVDQPDAQAEPADTADTADSAEPRGEASPESVAYVIYTSGSTGTPKGVVVPHRAIANHLLGMGHAYGFGPADVGIVQGSYTFDKWLIEVFGPLLAGGSVRLLTSEELREPARALPAMRGVTLLYAVPAVLRQLLDEAAARGDAPLASIRHVFTGGDRVPPDLLAQARAALAPDTGIRVVYGPTETTVVCTAWEVPADGKAAGHPIGLPLPNTRAFIRGATGTLVPEGTPGELWIGGEGIARGYLGRPGLTAEAFIPDPFGPAGARLYRTGDRVRRRPDGALEYLGRLDEQVKVRGFRIEPGEIEAVLRAQPGVSACVVVVREDAGEARLVAYVAGTADAGALRARLRESLPYYMVPSAFVTLDALPLNANGKVDRRALPAPEPASAEQEYAAPLTPVEEILAGIWAAVLGRERVGIGDHFFDIGGHSLLATRVVARIRDALDGDVSVATLAEHPTIQGLAPFLSERRAAGAPLVDEDSSPDRLLAMMDQLSDEELERLLAAYPELETA